MKRHVLLAVGLFCISVLSLASESEDVNRLANNAYVNKEYAKSAPLYAKAVALSPHNAAYAYDAACSYALAGNVEKAFQYLDLALGINFFDAAHMAEDTDLTTLHADARWPMSLKHAQINLEHFNKLYRSEALATPYTANLSQDEKLAGLAKFWSEVKYNLLNEDVLETLDWDRILLDYIPKVRATDNTAQYYEVLAELARKLDDGETEIIPPSEELETAMAAAPIRTRLLEGRIIVYEVMDEALHNQGVLPGLEVIAVDGIPAIEYARQKYQSLHGGGTEQRRMALAGSSFFLRGPIGIVPLVRFARADGSQFELPVQRISWSQFQERMEHVPTYEISNLAGNVAYLQINRFVGDVADEIVAHSAEWKNASALIIDLRRDEDGSTYGMTRLLRCLMPGPFLIARRVSRSHHAIDLTYGGNSQPYVVTGDPIPSDPGNRYDKSVYVLTSPITAHSGEQFVATLNRYQRAVTVGETTGATSLGLAIPLPAKGWAWMATTAILMPDGTPLKDGQKPDIPVQQTISDMRRGVDTVLEAALSAAQHGDSTSNKK